MNTTPEALIKEYADPIEQQEIDKFVCAEMGRQIHRYIKGMSGVFEIGRASCRERV